MGASITPQGALSKSWHNGTTFKDNYVYPSPQEALFGAPWSYKFGSAEYLKSGSPVGVEQPSIVYYREECEISTLKYRLATTKSSLSLVI